MHLKEFDELVSLFKNTKYHVYMIGGTSRDFLLGKKVFDYDFVTDATPEEMMKFLPHLDITFQKYGSCHLVINNKKIDITTLREEGDYLDSRHPSYIKFVRDINIDYKRRDFTINAIYINENYEIIDPSNGYKDLKSKILRCIGDPNIRLKEDPLRIIRAERFSELYNLEISDELRIAMKKNYSLVSKLNPDKIAEEKRKLEKAKKLFGENL